MNPFIKLLPFISFFVLFFSTRTDAQVTIGSATPPAAGALLQLKNADLADNANATKGLGMPRVALTDIDELNPAVDTKNMTQADADAAKKAHIGLLVYNLTTNGAEGELDQAGIYVWDGEMWTLVKKEKAGNSWWVMGSSSPATANTENVYTMGKVATGIDPGTSPTAQLTVAGASDLKGNTTIEGTTTLQKDLIVGATGSSGTEGQVLVSEGVNKSPRWHTLNIPIAKPGEYILAGSAALSDDAGLIWSAGAEQRKYEIGDPITGYGSVAQGVWTELDGFRYDFSITKSDNKVSVTLQTLAHMDKIAVPDKQTPLLTFAIGVFIDDKLATVKVYEIAPAIGSISAFMIPTMMTHLENLPIGDHTLKVALIPRLFRNYNSRSLTVGRPNPDSDNISQFMASSSMKIDVFVKSDDN